VLTDVDHETALQAANQALSRSALRSSSRIASIELRGVDPMRRTGPALPSLDDRPSHSNEAWQLAAMLGVALATLIFVVTLWVL
jgi:hypothetical protein